MTHVAYYTEIASLLPLTSLGTRLITFQPPSTYLQHVLHIPLDSYSHHQLLITCSMQDWRPFGAFTKVAQIHSLVWDAECGWNAFWWLSPSPLLCPPSANWCHSCDKVSQVYFAYCKRSKNGCRKGLGTGLHSHSARILSHISAIRCSGY